MSDDYADRTEAATPRRREQFRREGRIARSADLTAGIVVMGCVLVLSAAGAGIAASLESLMKSSLSLKPESSIRSVTFAALAALAPILLGVFAIAIGANFIQIGRPTLRRPAFKRGQRPKLSFIGGLLKLAITGWVTYTLLAARLPQIISASHADLAPLLILSCQTLFTVALRLALILVAFGLIDYTIQRFRLEKQLKMTRRELRDELRQTEGDPRLKSRRRELRMRRSGLNRA